MPWNSTSAITFQAYYFIFKEEAGGGIEAGDVPN
jgi:hypothetical protein